MEDQDINLYWRRIVDTMSDGLILVDTNGSITMVNQSFEQLTGYSSDEIIGQPCTILHCDACETTLKQEHGKWCALFDYERDVKHRCLIMKKDGTYLLVLKNASIIKNDLGVTLGAVEILTDISELSRLDQEIDQLSRQLDDDEGFFGIIGKSAIMQNVFEVVQKTAQSDAPVIIYGESGTGKELIARAIHLVGRRREGPFVQLNCAALNEALLESELFGHIKGAFTGAYRHRLGL